MRILILVVWLAGENEMHSLDGIRRLSRCLLLYPSSSSVVSSPLLHSIHVQRIISFLYPLARMLLYPLPSLSFRDSNWWRWFAYCDSLSHCNFIFFFFVLCRCCCCLLAVYNFCIPQLLRNFCISIERMKIIIIVIIQTTTRETRDFPGYLCRTRDKRK